MPDTLSFVVFGAIAFFIGSTAHRCCETMALKTIATPIRNGLLSNSFLIFSLVRKPM
ncbi:MAG: hypothetical protein RMY33_025380 [Nostoc sp. DedQUE03]